ncbi:hypothetical protein CC78DRAFT_578563 [Lojkania enalia]|uniref:Extracellular serine-threonine rich protein n=1 Tax=Lojkania enalia TaxID=147567 RepID=A0A9P4N7E3_9PLEO|nr:hypothetical protein CC78DRAFT_578563 [Didymosphaeria enalia]
MKSFHLVAFLGAVSALASPDNIRRDEHVKANEAVTTTTVTTTSYMTVTECAGKATECPGNGTVFVTSVVAVTTTVCSLESSSFPHLSSGTSSSATTPEPSRSTVWPPSTSVPGIPTSAPTSLPSLTGSVSAPFFSGTDPTSFSSPSASAPGNLTSAPGRASTVTSAVLSLPPVSGPGNVTFPYPSMRSSTVTLPFIPSLSLFPDESTTTDASFSSSLYDDTPGQASSSGADLTTTRVTSVSYVTSAVTATGSNPNTNTDMEPTSYGTGVGFPNATANGTVIHSSPTTTPEPVNIGQTIVGSASKSSMLAIIVALVFALLA